MGDWDLMGPITWLRMVRDSDVGHLGLSVATAIVLRASGDGRFFASQAKIATDARLSLASVKRGLADLRRAGLVIAADSSLGRVTEFTLSGVAHTELGNSTSAVEAPSSHGATGSSQGAGSAATLAHTDPRVAHRELGVAHTELGGSSQGATKKEFKLESKSECKLEGYGEPSPPAAPTSRARASSTRPTQKPVLLPKEWEPSVEQVAALAAKYDCSEHHIRRTVPEFRLYWLDGKGQGKRRSPKGWAATFSNRVAQMARSEELYAERRNGVSFATDATSAREKARRIMEGIHGRP